MAILKKGIVSVEDSGIEANEFLSKLGFLDKGDYGFIIFDKEENPMLPMMRYIHSILIKNIHKKLRQQGYKVTEIGLYRFFEQKFAPEITEQVGDEMITYQNMKGLKTKELSDIADKIVEFGNRIGVTFPTRREMKTKRYNDKYVELYSRAWKNNSRRIK